MKPFANPYCLNTKCMQKNEKLEAQYKQKNLQQFSISTPTSTIQPQLRFSPYLLRIQSCGFISSPHKLVILRITTNLYTMQFYKIIILTCCFFRITMNLYSMWFYKITTPTCCFFKITTNLYNVQFYKITTLTCCFTDHNEPSSTTC